jgi:hypothetical protein
LPQMLVRVDGQGWSLVFMERAQAHKALAVLLEVNAPRLNKTHEVGVPFDGVDDALFYHSRLSLV